MQISATCPQNNDDRAWPQAGFTLLEVLVVLILMAAVAGLALPRLSSTYDSTERALDREKWRHNFGRLSWFAMEAGRSVAFASIDALRRAGLSEPEGCTVSVMEPVVVRANGSCVGGRLRLQCQSDAAVVVDVTGPVCDVQAEA